MVMAYVRGQIFNFTVVTQQQLMMQLKRILFVVKTFYPALIAHYQL
jgi:hypothetical protein